MATIFATYERATHADDVGTLESIGTVSGQGLQGTFHSWRSGANERDDETLGPAFETTLRLGDRIWIRNANGNVRELKGVLRRRAATSEYVDSGAFMHDPERAHFLGFGTVGDRRTWRVELDADGGEPETLWIDCESGLPLRTEYIDGDGPTYVDNSDWRDVNGMKIAFHSLTTDGDHQFDTVQQTTTIRMREPIDAAIFTPLESKKLIADGAQTVPLIDDGARVSCRVVIGGKPYTFLIDSGSGNVLLDSRVAKDAGVVQEGALEVRGAARAGGLQLARIPQLSIGTASLDDLVVSTIDLASAPAQTRIDGILGYPFFAASTVQLDFFHHTMRFGPPGSIAPLGDRLPLDSDREIPEVTLRINDLFNVPFIVDTGNSGGLLLYEPFVAKHNGLVTPLGGQSAYFGVGGSDKTYFTKVGSLQLGTIQLVRQDAEVILAKSGAFADQVDAGNIGLGVLRKFIVTFDFANSAMYLSRNVNFNDH